MTTLITQRQCDQRGVTIVLLLWMITGMSLMVTAVIHFAQEEITASEQRIKEVKMQALAVAAARLALRDMSIQTQPNAFAEDMDLEADLEGQASPTAPFSAVYSLSGVEVSVSLKRADGLFSLTSGTGDQLHELLVTAGGVSSAEADLIAEEFLRLKAKRPVSHREQFLSVNGVSKDLYDRIAAQLAPVSLAIAPASSSWQSAGNSLGSSDSAQLAGCEELSFACIDEVKADTLNSGSDDWMLADAEGVFPDGAKIQQRVVIDAQLNSVHRLYRPVMSTRGDAKSW